MKILIIGSGGREHAILRRLALDTPIPELHAAPGNPGIAQLATCHDVPVTDLDAQVRLAEELQPDLVVIGPEAPLVAGAADRLREAGFAVFGPSASAAHLEGSKSWAKEVMAAAGVPTAVSVTVTALSQLEAGLDRVNPLRDVPFVVKADGLAAGKGVVVTEDRRAAVAHAEEVLAAGGSVVLEEFLDGPEVSLFCLVDGETVVPLLPAQDHKRVFDNDEGPNTGGMGAYAPLPWLPEDGAQRIVDEVCVPVAREMTKRGCAYSGLLYAGIAWGEKGPAVVEFNCRFGDPETQAVLALLKTPLAGLLNSVATGTLAQQPELEWIDGYALTVVLASHNYPDTPRTGDVIRNADADNVLHAGTALNDNGELVSAGGRVLNVIGVGDTLEAARDQAYATIADIELDGSHYRTDIALPAVEGRISIPLPRG